MVNGKIQDPGITDTGCSRQTIRLFNWENGAYCTKFGEILNGHVGPHQSWYSSLVVYTKDSFMLEWIAVFLWYLLANWD